MNFKNYVNDILNESGCQLNEMLQSDTLIKGSETEKYKHLFLYAIKNKQFDKHFNTIGADKYSPDSKIYKEHKAANDFINKLSDRLAKMKPMQMAQYNNIYPTFYHPVSLSKTSVIAFIFADDNSLTEVVGIGNTEEDFTIITAFQVKDKTNLVAYAVKLRDMPAGKMILKKLLQKDINQIIPADKSIEEYENIIWDDLTNKRKQERDLDFNTIASHLANKVIEAYNITPNKNNQDILNKIFRYNPVLDTTKLDSALQTEIEAYRKKWGDNNKLTTAIATKILNYIKNS